MVFCGTGGVVFREPTHTSVVEPVEADGSPWQGAAMSDFAPGLLIMRKTQNGLDWDRTSKPRILLSINRQQRAGGYDEYWCHFLIIDARGPAIDSWAFRPYDREAPELPRVNERTGKVEHQTLSWDWYVIGTGQEAYRKGRV